MNLHRTRAPGKNPDDLGSPDPPVRTNLSPGHFPPRPGSSAVTPPAQQGPVGLGDLS